MKTKYYKNWDDYKADNPKLTDKQEKAIKARMTEYEEKMFHFVMFLLM